MNPALVVAVLVAGAIGAVIRYVLARALVDRTALPWAVFLVNVVGSAIGGALLGLAARGELGGDLRLVLLTGFCGGLTTFSTWSVETIQLVEDGRWRSALLSVAGNLLLGVGAAAAAFAIVAARL